jgi:hypothetical protein
MQAAIPGVGLNRGVGLIRATARDVDALTESQALSFRDGGGPSGYESRRWNRRMVADALYYQITLDGREVGGLIVLRLAWDHFHILRIWVEPGFQRHGVRSRALALLEASHRQASLWTVEAPARAHGDRHLYECSGYRVTRETGGTVHFEKRRPPILRLRSLL